MKGGYRGKLSDSDMTIIAKSCKKLKLLGIWSEIMTDVGVAAIFKNLPELGMSLAS